MKAYDLLIQCESGLASIIGSEAEPGRVGVSVADIACGMNAHAAILEALIARGKTGEGRSIAVSRFDSIVGWMAVPLLHHDYGDTPPKRVGLKHPSIAPNGAFICADGRQVVITVQNERECARLFDFVLGDSAIAGDRRFSSNSLRVANRPALDAEVSRTFAKCDAEAIIEKLGEAGIAYSAVNEVVDLSRYSQLRHSQLRQSSANRAIGSVGLPAQPAIFAGQPPMVPQVPSLGASTDAVRNELAAS